MSEVRTEAKLVYLVTIRFPKSGPNGEDEFSRINIIRPPIRTQRDVDSLEESIRTNHPGAQVLSLFHLAGLTPL